MNPRLKKFEKYLEPGMYIALFIITYLAGHMNALLFAEPTEVETKTVVIENDETEDLKMIINKYELIIQELERELENHNITYNINTVMYNDILEQLTDEEWELLYKVATSEAGYNSREGQQNVVKVVLNRVMSDDFPNSIEEVIYEKRPDGYYQFSVVDNNYINTVDVTEFTKLNVQDAYLDYVLEVENYDIGGALFFGTIERNRTYLFTDEVGHIFYK